MEWRFSVDGDLEALEALEEEGMEIDTLTQEPTLTAFDVIVWNLFQVLHRRRTYGLTPNPITMGDMLGYLNVCGYSKGPELLELLDLLSHLDDTWLRLMHAKQQAKTENTSEQDKGAAPRDEKDFNAYASGSR